jgi:hypothetical protein
LLFIEGFSPLDTQTAVIDIYSMPNPQLMNAQSLPNVVWDPLLDPGLTPSLTGGTAEIDLMFMY